MVPELYVYVVLGAASGEWRNWVEGIFTDEEQAHRFLTEVEADDGGWNSYYIVEGLVKQ